MNERKWNETGVQAGEMEAFRQIVAALRAPDGCPWDRKQTFESLKPCMINEMTEALAGIDILKQTGRAENLCEELGDVLLQVVLLTQIAEEQELFTLEDVIRGVSRKMIRRHPHVFGELLPEVEAELGGNPFADKNSLAEEIPGLWEAIKREEKKNRTSEQKQLEKEAFEKSAAGVIHHLQGKLQPAGNP